MAYLAVALAALAASFLTLFSGFGLGTFLLPVFAVFFPLPLAVTATAIVHLLNNLFKVVLLGRHADRGVVLRFGLPAVAASFAGAAVLAFLSGGKPLWTYSFFGRAAEGTVLKLVMAGLMVYFALSERPGPEPKKGGGNLVWGGLLSGFFGGLSGHQGAFRSAYLIQRGLSKEAFIGTGIVIACLVDFIRLGVYSARFPALGKEQAPLILTAVLSAFLGAWIGNRNLAKVTIGAVRVCVAVLMFVIAAALAAGIL